LSVSAYVALPPSSPLLLSTLLARVADVVGVDTDNVAVVVRLVWDQRKDLARQIESCLATVAFAFPWAIPCSVVLASAFAGAAGAESADRAVDVAGSLVVARFVIAGPVTFLVRRVAADAVAVPVDVAAAVVTAVDADTVAAPRR
jgi:hypothetical protein